MCPGSTWVLGSSLHVSLCWGEGAMWRGQLAGAGWDRGCPAAVTFFLFFLLVFSALEGWELPHQEVGAGGDSWFFEGFEAQPSTAPQKGWGLLLKPKNCPGHQATLSLVGFSKAKGKAGVGQDHVLSRPRDKPRPFSPRPTPWAWSALSPLLASLLGPASGSDVLSPARNKPFSSFLAKLKWQARPLPGVYMFTAMKNSSPPPIQAL